MNMAKKIKPNRPNLSERADRIKQAKVKSVPIEHQPPIQLRSLSEPPDYVNEVIEVLKILFPNPLADLMGMNWMSYMGRKEAEEFLNLCNGNTAILRPSSCAKHIALSMLNQKSPKAIQHYLIRVSDTGFELGGRNFDTINQILDRLKKKRFHVRTKTGYELASEFFLQEEIDYLDSHGIPVTSDGRIRRSVEETIFNLE